MTIPSFTAPTQNYSVTPAGKDVFNVSKIDYIEEKNTVKITYNMLKANRNHSEFYNLDNKYQVNALGNMLRAAYQKPSLVEFDEALIYDSVGRQFEGKINHRKWEEKTYANIDAFSYKAVNELRSFAQDVDDEVIFEDDIE